MGCAARGARGFGRERGARLTKSLLRTRVASSTCAAGVWAARLRVDSPASSSCDGRGATRVCGCAGRAPARVAGPCGVRRRGAPRDRASPTPARGPPCGRSKEASVGLAAVMGASRGPAPCGARRRVSQRLGGERDWQAEAEGGFRPRRPGDRPAQTVRPYGWRRGPRGDRRAGRVWGGVGEERRRRTRRSERCAGGAVRGVTKRRSWGLSSPPSLASCSGPREGGAGGRGGDGKARVVRRVHGRGARGGGGAFSC